MLTVAIWVEMFQGRRCFTFAMAKWKFLRFDNISNFATFNLYTVQTEILYLQRYSSNFRNRSPKLEDVEVGHLGEKFQVRRYFTFAIARWKLGASTTFEILPRSTCTLCQQKSYISKGIQLIFEIFRQLEDVEGGHLGGKFQVRRYFTFAMARWKLGASTTFEILPRSTCTLCQQKSYISKGIQAIFEIFASSRRCWRVAIWVESFRCAGILLLQWQGENFAHRQYLKFCHFQPVHCASKNPISPKVFNRFSKSSLSSKMLTVAIWVKSFRCAAILLLQWQGENFAHRQHLKFCHYQPVHCASKNPISPKLFNRFSKSLPQLEDVDGGHLGVKVSGAQVFCFCNGKVKTWRIDNIWNFATFNLYTVPAKILYLQRYSGDFRNLGLISKMWTMAIWVKSFRCACILVRQWEGENVFASTYFWNFPTFNLYTVPTKIIYLERFSGDFRNIRLRSSTMWRVGIWLKSFRCARCFTSAMANWKRLCIDNIWNFATFNLYTVQSEILYLQRYTTNFRNLRVSSKMLRVGIWLECFRCAGILLLQWQGENVGASTTFEILQRSTGTLCKQKSYISKGIQSIFEIFASARRCWRWSFGWKVSGAQVFYFCNGKLKTWRIDNIWNFATFNLYTVPAKILYLQRYSTNFRNLPLSSKMLTVAIWVESFRCARVLLLQWQIENLAHRQHFKFCHFQHVHCASRNPISPKIFNQFSKSSRQLEDVEGGHLGGKF